MASQSIAAAIRERHILAADQRLKRETRLLRVQPVSANLMSLVTNGVTLLRRGHEDTGTIDGAIC